MNNIEHEPDTAFAFSFEQKEVIKITEEGKFFVHGKEVTEDIKLYEAFKDFFTVAGYYKEKEVAPEEQPGYKPSYRVESDTD